MKKIVYMCIVDIWGIMCKYHFHKLNDSEWEEFVIDGQKFISKYQQHGKRIEQLARNLFGSIQNFYQEI